MKKRMFLTTVLMALVLLLAVTTATFAWYSAQAGNVVYTPDTTAAVETEATEIALEGVTFTAEFTTDVHEEIVLTNAEGNTGYMVGTTPFVISIPGNQKGYSNLVVKVTASLTDGENAEGTLKDALAALYAAGTTTVTLTIKHSENLRVSKDTATVYNPTGAVTFVLNLEADGSVSVWDNNTFYYSAVGLQTKQEEADFANSKITASLS